MTCIKRIKLPFNISKIKYEYDTYMKLLENPNIKELLNADKCKIIADNYTLAIVLIYFQRANLPVADYTWRNFYVALYIVHDMYEEDNAIKSVIIKYYIKNLKSYTKQDKTKFFRSRTLFLKNMNFHTIVSKRLCRKLMATNKHWAWDRKRNMDHEGAFYRYPHLQKHCCTTYL